MHRHNGHSHEALDTEHKMVWGCGNCESQGHRLMEEGQIVCGACLVPSSFVYYEPTNKRMATIKHPMRLVKSNFDNQENWICGKCGFNRFHIQQSGTLTCYRCRHAASVRWWNPSTGEPART